MTLSILAVFLVAAAPPEPAAQVRTLFQRHCVQCHGSAKGAKADLNLLDRSQLVAPGRSLVVPGHPEQSMLLQLVECGAMPSGTAPKLTADERTTLRTWIAAGAADFPPRSGEPYILAQILADVSQLQAAERANVRYLSLNHLLDDPDAAKDLDKYRAGLERALNVLSANKQPIALRPIDPENTIFRIRLDDLGWDKRPFVADPKNTAKDVEPTQVNLFDLVLLEYPYATPPDQALVESYFKPAHLLRPVAYVRGDWFAATATQPPLYGELLSLPGSLNAKMPPPAADDPLLFVTKHFVRKSATVPPVDGLTLPQCEPAQGLLKVELAVLDAEGKPRTEFHPGDKIKFSLKNTGAVKVHYELIATDVKGTKFVLQTGELEPDADITFPVTIGDKPGKEQLTVFAAREGLPAAVRLKTEKEGAARIVHPSYKIEDGVVKMLFDPAHVIKHTITFETLKQ